MQKGDENIKLNGYPFASDTTETYHGGTGFYVNESSVFNKRDDFKFNSAGNFESTFIEIILPKRKYIIMGCIYQHPTSIIHVHQFNNDYIVPLLENISAEDKICSLVGDFNIDFLKNDSTEDVDTFYNSMNSHLFALYILQPTRPKSKSFIDNILINSVEFLSHTGNLTISL